MTWEQSTVEGNWEPQSKPAAEQKTAYTPKRSYGRNQEFGLGYEIKTGNMPMFMTGPEIKEHYVPYEGDKNPSKGNIFEPESDAETWARKGEEAKMTGTERYGKESFERDSRGAWRSLRGPALARQGIGPNTSIENMAKVHGIKGHVSVETKTMGTDRKPQVLGGHHRVALASEQFKNHIFPVKHFDSLEQAQEDRHYQ